MFGHQDDKKHDNEHHETVIAPDEQTAETVTAGAEDQSADQALPAAAIDDTAGAPEPQDSSAPAADDDAAWQHPGAPLTDQDDNDEDTKKGPAPIKDIVGESAGPGFKPFSDEDDDEPKHDAEDDDSEAAVDVPGVPTDDIQPDTTPHDLIDVKQKALNDLTPLVDKLEQEPEDRFRTIMMMIQASDDQSLVKEAYQAAHQIKDEKVRAQALLDVVNEINYFTQHPEQ